MYADGVGHCTAGHELPANFLRLVRSHLRPPLNSCMLCRHARGCTLGELLSRPRGGGSSAHMPLAMCVGSGAAAQWYKNAPGCSILKVAVYAEREGDGEEHK